MTYQLMNTNPHSTIYTGRNFSVTSHTIRNIVYFSVVIWNGIEWVVVATTAFWATIERMMLALWN